MNPDRFYPYRTAADEIRLEIDPEGADLPRGSDGSILAFADDGETVGVHISIAIPDSVFDKVVAPAERGNPPLDLQLLYQSVESRKRCVLSLPGDGVHEGRLILRRRDWRGAVEMRAVLVRTADVDHGLAGYAGARGSLVAWSAPRRVVFDEPLQPPGGQLRVRWEKFSTSPSRWRREHADNLFALDTTGDLPVVFLNSAVSQAYPVLQSSGTRGRRARIRDATYSMIVHQVWSSLLAIALAELAQSMSLSEEESLDPETRLEQIPTWQQSILRDWSTYLYPDRDPESALEELVSAGGDARKTGDVMSRLPNAIQKRLRTVRGFEGMVREGERM